MRGTQREWRGAQLLQSAVPASPGTRMVQVARDSSGKSPGNHGRSSFGVPNGGLEDQQKVEKVLDFSCIYDIT